ncbi:MAG TPA: hypothetical protein VLT89_16730 [Usitatibacter sp.]|nr:hypothetical protein [Usitatibacter sp.]
MDTVVRRIGNSLGVIIPRRTLEAWGVHEGERLAVTSEGIFPPSKAQAGTESLDELKRKLAAAVASSFTPRQIRAQSLANLHRWKSNGVWVSAYDEWKRIMERGDDGELFAAMLGRDERATRLRQSAPYAGLLPRSEVARLNEEAAR